MARTVKHVIGSGLDAVGLYTPVALWRRRRTPTVIAKYLRAAKTKMLHLGCGTHSLLGWLNADIEPASGSVIYLDATLSSYRRPAQVVVAVHTAAARSGGEGAA